MTTATDISAESRIDHLLDLGRAMERIFEVRLRPFKLSTAQLRILELCYKQGPETTPTQIARALLQQVHSVSGLLNRLEDLGMITRSFNKLDRRVVNVALTPYGDTTMTLADAARRRLELEVREVQEKYFLDDWAEQILALDDWKSQRPAA